VGIALDMVKGEMHFSVNNVWSSPMGVAFTGIDTNEPLFPAISGCYTTVEINFGDRQFMHSPPDGSYVSVLDSL